jgi:hypothetical protein
MTQWLKKAKITVVAGAMALVLVGTSFGGISQISSAEASFGHNAELVTGSVQHDMDAKRGGKIKKGDDGSGGFGTGGRRGRFD